MCSKCQPLANLANSAEAYCESLSEMIISGIPWRRNCIFNFSITVAESVLSNLSTSKKRRVIINRNQILTPTLNRNKSVPTFCQGMDGSGLNVLQMSHLRMKSFNWAFMRCQENTSLAHRRHPLIPIWEEWTISIISFLILEGTMRCSPLNRRPSSILGCDFISKLKIRLDLC